MESNWKLNIYNSIRDFSDIDKQKKLWLGRDKKYSSSFDEDISLLFDSFCFEEFIDSLESEKEEYGILIKELKIFKKMLNNYKKKNSDIEILDDLEWHKIVNKAKLIIELWKI